MPTLALQNTNCYDYGIYSHNFVFPSWCLCTRGGGITCLNLCEGQQQQLDLREQWKTSSKKLCRSGSGAKSVIARALACSCAHKMGMWAEWAPHLTHVSTDAQLAGLLRLHPQIQRYVSVPARNPTQISLAYTYVPRYRRQQSYPQHQNRTYQREQRHTNILVKTDGT